MSLNPEDVARRTFAIEDRGYDRDEVRTFLFEVAAALRLALHGPQGPLEVHLLPPPIDEATAAAEPDSSIALGPPTGLTDVTDPVRGTGPAWPTADAGDDDGMIAALPDLTSIDETEVGATTADHLVATIDRDDGVEAEAELEVEVGAEPDGSGDPFSLVGAQVADVLRAAHDAVGLMHRKADADAEAIRAQANVDADVIRRNAEAEAARQVERARRVLVAAQEQADGMIVEAEAQARAVLTGARDQAEEHAQQVASRVRKHAEQILRAERESLRRLHEAHAHVAEAIDVLADAETRPVVDLTTLRPNVQLGPVSVDMHDDPGDARVGDSIDPVARMVRAAVGRAVTGAAEHASELTDDLTDDLTAHVTSRTVSPRDPTSRSARSAPRSAPTDRARRPRRRRRPGPTTPRPTPRRRRSTPDRRCSGRPSDNGFWPNSTAALYNPRAASASPVPHSGAGAASTSRHCSDAPAPTPASRGKDLSMAGSVILSGARTPVGKLSGAFAGFAATDLGGFAIKAALERAGLSPDQIDYVFMGHVLGAGAGQITARQAAVNAGIAMDVPATTINKVCLSGLNAIYLADQMINAGDADVVVAGGMESMTNAPYLLPGARAGYRLGDQSVVDSLMHDGLFCAFDQVAMGAGTQKYASSAGIERDEQDDVAAKSHQRAALAQKNGLFDNEIVPVEVPQRKGDPLVVSADEGVRGDTTNESLAGLRPAFDKAGNITAGNASQISDGGSAVIVASKAAAEKLGIEPLGEIVGFGQVAGPDASLLTQPSRAILKALDKAGKSVSDVDLFELNEAFAAVGIASMRDLGITDEITNVNGGAISIGHPLGASGNRIALTLLNELKRRGGGLGAAALCGGGGQGDAILLKV